MSEYAKGHVKVVGVKEYRVTQEQTAGSRLGWASHTRRISNDGFAKLVYTCEEDGANVR